MKRRRFLAALGILCVPPSAGCLSPLSETGLSNPAVEREDDGETHLHFESDGERLATVTVQPGRRWEANRVPVDVHVWHRRGTRVEDVRLVIRAPAGGSGVPADVALTAPGGLPRPDIEFYTDPETGGTVLDAGKLGPNGKGTVTFEFLVTPFEEVAGLGVDAAVGLREEGPLGKRYRLEARTRVPLP